MPYRESAQAVILAQALLIADTSTLYWYMKRCLSLYQWGMLIRPQRHHIWIYAVFSTSRLFSVDSGTATLLSPRIFQPDSIPYRGSAQAVILAQAPLVADTSTLYWYVKRRLSLYQWGVLIRPQRHHIWIIVYGVFSTSRLFSGDSGTATHAHWYWYHVPACSPHSLVELVLFICALFKIKRLLLSLTAH